MFAQLPDNSDKWKWLASDEQDALEELANIYNDCVRDLHNEFPLLNVTSTTLTTVANQAYVSLPANFRDTDILSLAWSESGYAMDLHELVRIAPADAQELPARGIAPSDTDEYPSYFSLSWDAARIRLFPTPSGAKTLLLTYRAKETPVTAADVQAGATTISSIPDAMIKMLAINIARDLCDRGGNQARITALLPMLSQEVDTWTDKMSGDLVSLRTNVMQNGGLPRIPDEAQI